jgi:hypothetical protein
MLNALRTGAQVTNPTFSNVPQQATTAGPDIMGATNAASNYALADFNAGNAAQQNFNSGLFSLGGAGIMAMSDMRMKENVKPIGAINGINLYEFEYKPEFKNHPFAGYGKQIGVIAQELQLVRPDAVSVHPSGYLMVNYGVLNG